MAAENSLSLGMTVDELARRAELPVRTIREYHTMRLLPAPERRGRVGYYGPEHLGRLELIARLQRRGYSLAGIRDLLQAWAAGTDLTALLGVEPIPAPLDELPLRLTADELLARVPALSGPCLAAAMQAGVIQPQGHDYLVRSPALLALVADGTAAGIPVTDILDLASMLRRQLSAVAESLAELLVTRLLPAVQERGEPRGEPGDLAPLLQRGRTLLLQGAASLLADRLGAAMLSQSADLADGDALRGALERIRVGAVGDASGSPRHRMTPAPTG
jgi:DNA-binding transcriptional MerR regulator